VSQSFRRQFTGTRNVQIDADVAFTGILLRITAQLAGAIDWDWIDGEIAPLYNDKGRPGIPTRFAIGLLLLKQIYGLSVNRRRRVGLTHFR
jgi:hypothetical protein